MTSSSPWILDAADVHRLEDIIIDANASLMQATIAGSPANPDGYALFDSGSARASLTTNPHARGFCSIVDATGSSEKALLECIAFFDARHVRPRAHVSPYDLDPARAALRAKAGLMQTGFHTVLHAPLDALPPFVREEGDERIQIEEVRDADRFETFLDVQIRGWGIPEVALEYVKSVRRPWRGAADHRFYLATLDDQPAAHAMTFEAGDSAYLSSANTLPAFRRQGLQTALIRRRINDARREGKRRVIGAADYESSSRTNMMRCGMQVAYTAAWWERP